MTRYKGQLGKVGVVGGSAVYSGAPFFAAMSALKAGAELAHVYSHPSAVQVIKSYSPEIIVHPWNNPQQQQQQQQQLESDQQQQQQQQQQQLESDQQELVDGLLMTDVIVVGPGLGREMETVGMVSEVLKRLVGIVNMLEGEAKLHTVILDADYLWLLANHNDDDPDFAETHFDLSYLRSSKHLRVILTPNSIELHRLIQAHNTQEKHNVDYQGLLELLRDRLGDQRAIKVQEGQLMKTLSPIKELADTLGVDIFLKGHVDVFYHQETYYIQLSTGSTKRPGGLGDILSGVLAVMTHWGTHAKHKIEQKSQLNKVEETNDVLSNQEIKGLPAAAMLASWILKNSQVIAEKQVGIFSLGAQDVINHLHKSLQDLEILLQ